MTARVTLTVGQRLFLAVLPAILAVALVVALAYYGEFGRQAPGLVTLGAAVLALVSLGVTWVNTRYVARRVGRLAGRAAAGGADELDRIEQAVDQLGSALSASEAERARVAATAEARLRDQGELLAAESAAAIARLDDVRLPLHILLDTAFGELTPNQEELLADARDAAQAADAALRRLRALGDADRGALVVARGWVALDDVVRGAVPAARARAERRGGRLALELEPALPRVVADRARLAEALALVLGAAADALGDGGAVRVAATRAAGAVVLTVGPVPAGGEALLGRRLLEAQGLAVAGAGPGLTVVLPTG